MALDEKSLNGQHLEVKCSLLDEDTAITLKALIDYEASKFAFVDKNFACQHNNSVFKLKINSSLEVIDGRPIESGDIT